MCYHSQKKIFPLQKDICLEIYSVILNLSRSLSINIMIYTIVLFLQCYQYVFKYVTYKSESNAYVWKLLIMKSFILPNFIIFQNT
jgi:hypothetical protein